MANTIPQSFEGEPVLTPKKVAQITQWYHSTLGDSDHADHDDALYWQGAADAYADVLGLLHHTETEPDWQDRVPAGAPEADRVSPANSEGDGYMRTFLVAVVAPSEEDVLEFLSASPLGPKGEDSPIDCWWIAEDDRHDGSDNDSAIFVPRGGQADMAHVIRNHIEFHADEWTEDGYPYEGTDVSGTWFQAGRPSCQGHESLAGEDMGQTVYCDGTCRS